MGSKYAKVMVYGSLVMYVLLTSTWPWLWPDAYYHATVTHIYLLSVINVELVLLRSRQYDRWLLKGVCMSAGISFIEIIDEVNKTAHIIDSDPEKFKFWEYWTMGFIVCICLVGMTRFRISYTCIRNQVIKITTYTNRNTTLLWRKIITAWKGWNLHKRRGN